MSTVFDKAEKQIGDKVKLIPNWSSFDCWANKILTVIAKDGSAIGLDCGKKRCRNGCRNADWRQDIFSVVVKQEKFSKKELRNAATLDYSLLDELLP